MDAKDLTFGVEIETFGLKYSISAGDQGVIPPYKITNRSPGGMGRCGRPLRVHCLGKEPPNGGEEVADDCDKNQNNEKAKQKPEHERDRHFCLFSNRNIP